MTDEKETRRKAALGLTAADSECGVGMKSHGNAQIIMENMNITEFYMTRTRYLPDKRREETVSVYVQRIICGPGYGS